MKTFFKAAPYSKIFFSFLSLIMTYMELAFWGISVKTTSFLMKTLFVVLVVILSETSAQYFALKTAAETGKKKISISNLIKQLNVEFKSDDQKTLRGIIFALAGAAVCVFFLIVSEDSALVTNITLVLFVICVVVICLTQTDARFIPFYEIADAALVVLLPALLVADNLYQKVILFTIISMQIPAMCYYLSFQFSIAMVRCQENGDFIPGQFRSLIQKGSCRFLFLIYVPAAFFILIGWMNGVFWRLLSGALLTIPFICAQIALYSVTVQKSDWVRKLSWMSFATCASFFYFMILGLIQNTY